MSKHFKEQQERYLEPTHGYNIVLALVYVMLKIKNYYNLQSVYFEFEMLKMKQGVTKEK